MFLSNLSRLSGLCSDFILHVNLRTLMESRCGYVSEATFSDITNVERTPLSGAEVGLIEAVVGKSSPKSWEGGSTSDLSAGMEEDRSTSQVDDASRGRSSSCLHFRGVLPSRKTRRQASSQQLCFIFGILPRSVWRLRKYWLYAECQGGVPFRTDNSGNFVDGSLLFAQFVPHTIFLNYVTKLEFDRKSTRLNSSHT